MTIQVRNPRTGSCDYEFEATSPEEVAAIADRLKAAQPAWASLSAEDRARVLDAWADAIEAVEDRLVNALATDTGRFTLSQLEVRGAIGNIRRWVSQGPALLETEEKASELLPSLSYRNQYVPYGVAGFISPWNFPLTLSLIDAVPALMAGSAVLIKPSEVTPRFVEPLFDSIQAVSGLSKVVAFAPGDGTTGAAVVDAADLICFTGSVATGRKVAEAAAAQFKPAFLELGGKDPVIVLEGACLEKASDAVLRGSVQNSGQVCLSIERIYVDEAIHDEFVRVLTRKAKSLRFNYPDIKSGEIGPLIFERQADVIARHIADAVEHGGTILSGGEIEDHGGGKWVFPTVIDNATHAMAVMREETFGPLMPVMPFKEVAEAVRLANDTDFGLSASVIGGSLEEAKAVAEEVNAGGVSINDCGLTIATYEPEKNAFNLSGMGGSRMGPASIYRFLRKKALIMQHGDPSPITDLT